MTIDYPHLAATHQFANDFPDVTVFGCTLHIEPRGTPRDLAGEWAELHQLWRGKVKAAVAQVPEIAAYREFYRRIGLNPDKAPPSTQNLIQRFLLGEQPKPLPPLPHLVNVVNVMAVKTLVPLGAFDAGAVVGEVRIDYAGNDEMMLPIGASSEVDVPEGAVVLRDNDKILSQFGHRDGNAQKITPDTRELLLLACHVPGIAADLIERSLNQTVEALRSDYSVTVHNKL